MRDRRASSRLAEGAPTTLPQPDVPTVIAAPAQLADALASRITSIVDSLAPRSWSFAVSGGSVATLLLPHLAQLPLPWHTAHVFFVDERWVAAGSNDSNWRLCRAAAEGTPLEQARWHQIDTTLEDPSSSARAYLRTLTSVIGEPLALDVVLLGVGEDGHVASVFPGSELEAGDEKTIAFVTDAPKPPARRVSMSLPLLAGARLTAIAAFGRGKRQIVQAALEPACTLPVARLLRQARHPLLLLDSDAATRPVAD